MGLVFDEVTALALFTDLLKAESRSIGRHAGFVAAAEAFVEWVVPSIRRGIN